MNPRIRSLILPVLLLAVSLVGPAPGALAAALDVQSVTSPGGIEAWLVEDHNVPVVAIQVAFRGGAATDPEDRAGLANMVSGLLDEGAGDLDSQAFQKKLEDLSISLGFDAGADSFSGSLYTLKENLDEAVDLMALALTEPRFDEDAVARIRDQIMIGLARDATDPGSTAYRNWLRLVFADHPYGTPVEGTVASVPQIDVDDMRTFVRGRLARDNMIVGVAGDITPEELGPLLDEAFGALPAEAEGIEVAEAALANAGETVVIERPIPQSIVVMGEAGVAREDPDWYAALILNYVLGGGGFNSRLMQEVREKRGLAYSVATSLHPLDHAPLLIGQVATQNDRVAESVAIIRSEWTRIAEEGLTEEELGDAKTYLTGSFPLSLDNTRRVAAVLVSVQENDLGIDYLQRRDELIEGVTMEDAQRVAKRLFDPEALRLVIVGQPADVTPTRPPPEAG